MWPPSRPCNSRNLCANFATAMEAGHITLLLNGWNEVSDDVRQRANADLASLLSQFPGASVVGTSRSIPKLKFSQPSLNLRIDELNDAEIYHGLRTAHIPNVENVFRKLCQILVSLSWHAFHCSCGSWLPPPNLIVPCPAPDLNCFNRSVLRASQEHENFSPSLAS